MGHRRGTSFLDKWMRPNRCVRIAGKTETERRREQRDAEILRRWKRGETQAAIARTHGVTRQRVSQIVLAWHAGREQRPQQSVTSAAAPTT